jgi:hypothetical protein
LNAVWFSEGCSWIVSGMGQVYSRDISTASFMGRMVGAHIFDFAEPDVSAILWHVPSFLRALRVPI